MLYKFSCTVVMPVTLVRQPDTYPHVYVREQLITDRASHIFKHLQNSKKCHTLCSFNCFKIGWFQKISIPYHGWHLGVPKGRGGLRRLEFRGHGGGSLDWNSEGMGGFIGLEFRRHGGFSGE